MKRKMILPVVSIIAFFMPSTSAISASSAPEEDILNLPGGNATFGNNSGAFDEVQIPGI